MKKETIVNFLKKHLKIILPIVLILSALGIGKIIILTTNQPEKKKPKRTAYSVETISLKTQTQTVKLRITGTVVPALQIMLRSRVAGEVLEVAPEFIEGGSFAENDVILKIDPSDYQLALERKKAALAEAKYQLKLEEGRRDIAQREWELIHTDSSSSEADRELVLRVPHLTFRLANLDAAKAELEKASLDLARTEIRAPFNAVVVERKANLGTQATLQEALALLAGSDEFYVRATLPVDQLQWIVCDPKNGSKVSITRNTGEVRTGRVIRLESALEEKGRMARVLISVKNPLEGEQPLLLNEYVRIKIKGAPVEQVVRIPRSALHDDRWVWLATENDTLEIREVDVLWRDVSEVLISAGLADGERLILTNLSTPVTGMKLRIEGDSEEKQNGGGKSGKGQKSNEK